jgi:nicotinate-nucleotide adenylyltransferase
MIKLAIVGKSGFKISRYELGKKGKAYSVDTVRHFRKILPKKTRLYFLAGADIINNVTSWKESKKLFALCDFIILSRSGFGLEAKGAGFKMLDAKTLDVSSTMVRGLLQENKPVTGLVPRLVEDYIIRKGLYRKASAL